MPEFADPAAQRAPQILSVTELTRTVRELVEGAIGEVWVDGVKVVEKTDPAPAPLEVPFPPGTRQHPIVLLLHTAAGQVVGIVGPVTLNDRPNATSTP